MDKIKTKNRQYIFWTSVTGQIFGTKCSKSKLLKKKEELFEGRECSLSFSAKCFSSSLLSKNIKTTDRTIVLSVVFRGVKLDTSHFGRKNFENRVLRTISGPKKNEVTGELRGLHKTLLSTQLGKYFSGDQITKNEKGGACGRYGVRDRRIEAFGETLWK